MKWDLKQSHSLKRLFKFCSHGKMHAVCIDNISFFKGFKCNPTPGTYLAAVYWTHFNKAFLAFPWILVATFRLLGGLAASELTVLSTEDVLLDRDCSCGRLLVSSSIYVGGKGGWRFRNYLCSSFLGWFTFLIKNTLS